MTATGQADALRTLRRGGDHTITVTGRTEIGPHYLRLHFDAGRLLDEHAVYPTMWVRGWFPDEQHRVHQRGYTVVNPDPGAGTVDIDFAVHEGVATRWALAARPGDTLDVSVMGSGLDIPEPGPAGYLIAGDTASLPAINTLLDAIGDTPASVFLAAAHDEDRDLPVRGGDAVGVVWVDRAEHGLVDAVKAAAFPAGDHVGWVASDNRTTRAVARILREDYAIPRRAISAQGYWVG